MLFLRVASTARIATSRIPLIGAFTLVLLFARNPALSAQDGQSQSDDTYTIRGIVINSVTHAAVAHALVVSADNRFAKLTDGDGRFQFKIRRPPRQQNQGPVFTDSLSRGGMAQSRSVSSIFLMARKPGYFDSGGQQFWIDAEGDDPPEVRLSLIPEARITGRVNLSANDGTDKIQVQVYQRQVQEGRAHWIPAGSVTTRANGEFRFANLREGDYKLFTEELLDNDPLTFNPRGPTFGYPPVYFPSATDFESAAVIHLTAGQVFSATLTPSRREYHSVRLGVLNAPPGGAVGVSVQPQAHRGPGYSLGFNMNDSAIEGMLPDGSYTVEVTSYGETGGTGTVNLSVSGGPVRGSSVSIVPHGLIEARVRDERTRADTTLAPGLRNLASALNIRLTPTDEFTPGNSRWLQPAQDQENESLQFGNVPAGTYRVRAGCNPVGYVAAVNSGGRDLLQQPLVVGLGAAIPPLEITIRDDGAQLQGKIENWPPEQRKQTPSNRLGDAPTVVLLPMPDSSGQFCQMPATPTGEYNFPQVPPGEYRVLTFEHLPQDLEYENREAMQKYESSGLAVRLVAGQKEHLRLTLTTGSE